MIYTKPTVIAQNATTGSYAAGCPANNRGPDADFGKGPTGCLNCERTR